VPAIALEPLDMAKHTTAAPASNPLRTMEVPFRDFCFLFAAT
jgi:hypothetical protein